MHKTLSVDAHSNIAQELISYFDAICTPIELKSIDAKWLTSIYRTGRVSRQYENEFVQYTSEGLILIAESPNRHVAPRPAGLLRCSNNHLCPMFYLYVVWPCPPLKRTLWFVSFFQIGSVELNLLKTTVVKVFLLRGMECIAAVSFDLPNINPAAWPLIGDAQNTHALNDVPAAKSFIKWTIERPPMSSAEVIEANWAIRLEKEAEELDSWFEHVRRLPEFEPERQKIKSSRFGELFTTEESAISRIFEYYNTALWDKRTDYAELFCEQIGNLAETPLHRELIINAENLAWFSSTGTCRGRKIPSLESPSGIERIEINAEAFGDRADCFWKNFVWATPQKYSDIGSKSFPINISDFIETAPQYQGGIDEGKSFVDDLLAEAANLKQGTIPPGAYVQLDVGDIKAVKLYEHGTDVHCVLVNAVGDYLSIWANPNERVIPYMPQEVARASNKLLRKRKGIALTEKRSDGEWLAFCQEWSERHFLGIQILLAAIIRDFWVIDERERVFGASIKNTKSSRLNEDKDKPVIVYLPRVRYVGDLRPGIESLSFATRRAHFVVGHLRRALQASERQIQVARRFGVSVPEGFTFVQPHKRGHIAQERVYRSRSALHCIGALDPVSSSGRRDDWFRFELNIKEWLVSSGFEVVHIASNKNGDGGVDIQALKDDENLLLQCKRWKAKVGPNVIREMLGTLHTFPTGARGVIATSSELTEGAKRLAMKHGIQFIERIDFDSSIEAAI